MNLSSKLRKKIGEETEYACGVVPCGFRQCSRRTRAEIASQGRREGAGCKGRSPAGNRGLGVGLAIGLQGNVPACIYLRVGARSWKDQCGKVCVRPQSLGCWECWWQSSAQLWPLNPALGAKRERMRRQWFMEVLVILMCDSRSRARRKKAASPNCSRKKTEL